MIELVIVVAIVGILVSTAVPGYQAYMLRVHRTEAVRMLLQASLCQQREHANMGYFDTGRCSQVSETGRYLLSYEPPDTRGGRYLATATPLGPQRADECGSLTLDQNGTRGNSVPDASIVKCWNGR